MVLARGGNRDPHVVVDDMVLLVLDLHLPPHRRSYGKHGSPVVVVVMARRDRDVGGPLAVVGVGAHFQRREVDEAVLAVDTLPPPCDDAGGGEDTP